MPDVEYLADKIVIIAATPDGGKTVFEGSPELLKQQAETSNLEDAYVRLVDKEIHEVTV
jgi:ABC-type Na+ transport system ATPase subunit NatA